ncbi:hypothetical protein P879_01621 [Paragonimus westermani]|uniref:Reverse transcriptase domain-containing protein n=1 Tax=Paragonimus westermani TaxID=34504 RepID=A0A8T0DWL0_9TREM|nr:hypothetical protein P879_01621 [Paragonimus westermani]
MSLKGALSNCHDPKLVFHTPGGELNYLAYTDEVVLFFESREALSIRLERLQAGIHEIDLSIDSAKTACTHILADGRRNTTMLDSHPTLVSFTLTPSSSISPAWNVLGITSNWQGKLLTTAVRGASRMLQKVSQVPLEPQQRVEILRSHLIPRLFRQLTLGVVHKRTLRFIDTTVKTSVRKWLRFPDDISNAFFYSSINVVGVGIPQLQSQIPLDRRTRSDRHLASQDLLLHWALRQPSTQPFHRLALIPTIIEGEVVSTKQKAETA